MWKSNCPLNIITGCTTLSNKKCNQAFAITHNESFTSVWRNFSLILCANLFSFIHIWGFSSMNCLTWSLQNLNVPFFLSHSEVDLNGAAPLVFYWKTASFVVPSVMQCLSPGVKQRSSPDHLNTHIMFYCWDDVLWNCEKCVSLMPDAMRCKTIQKVRFLSC